VNAGVPLFFLVVLTVLMLQLQNFSRTAMVVLTAPLGLIGVTFPAALQQALRLCRHARHDRAVGHDHAQLGDPDRPDRPGRGKAGMSSWDAIVGSTVRRFRPIVLTAAAAMLAMIPLSRSAFFGPMAVAIMGGLIVATLLTLLFLPALYAAWYRVKQNRQVFG
jgi:multidrug efflux pump